MVSEAVVSEVVQTLAAGSLRIAVVSDDERFGPQSMAIETGGRAFQFGCTDPTHFTAETIGAWAERLDAFTATA